jgi:hypothetical protein
MIEGKEIVRTWGRFYETNNVIASAYPVRVDKLTFRTASASDGIQPLLQGMLTSGESVILKCFFVGVNTFSNLFVIFQLQPERDKS